MNRKKSTSYSSSLGNIYELEKKNLYQSTPVDFILIFPVICSNCINPSSQNLKF